MLQTSYFILDRGYTRFTKALEKAGKETSTVTIFEVPEGIATMSDYDINSIASMVEQRIAGGNLQLTTLEYEAPTDL